MTKDNITDFLAIKSNKIIEEAIFDLDEWQADLLNKGIDVITIIGILELIKHSLLIESIEIVHYD